MCRGKCTRPGGIRQHVWLDWVISFLLLINFIEYLKFYTAGGWAKGVNTHTTQTSPIVCAFSALVQALKKI